MDDPGDGYVSAPTVTIGGANTAPASATAAVNAGAVNGLTLTAGGSGYITPGIKKFEDALPGLCTPPACPTTGKYIPVAVPELKKYEGIEADEYVIGLVQYRTSFSSSLPDTLVRGYIQLETPANADISQHFPVTNELLDGTKVPVMQADGVTPWLAVTPPQWLGPTIGATKDKPVRIVFHNLLPTGNDGDLFLPVDTTLMGSGANPDSMSDLTGNGTVIDPIRNPPCTIKREPGINPNECFTENRATLHLHGGITPWISDGTPHQWITPAGEDHPLAAGRQRRQRPRHERLHGHRRRLPDLLLHEPAERPADVLPRSCVGHHPAQRVRRRGRRVPDHRRHREGTARVGNHPRRPDPARRPGPDVRPRRRPACPAGSRPGTPTAGAAWATSGTTTSTCRPRTPATRVA